jgi:hypothetical protein
VWTFVRCAEGSDLYNEPMPRIDDHFLDCSIYLYDSEQSARAGVRSGGSGFLAHVISRHPNLVHVYAVTNRHVIEQGFCVLRMNSQRQGNSEIIITEPSSWILHPDGDDVAIIPVNATLDKAAWFSIGTERFISEEIIADYALGPGDEAFLVGRLVTHDGQQRNTPVVRFGNLSMGLAKIKVDTAERDGFLVECRSLSGFSGSPVFS